MYNAAKEELIEKELKEKRHKTFYHTPDCHCKRCLPTSIDTIHKKVNKLDGVLQKLYEEIAEKQIGVMGYRGQINKLNETIQLLGRCIEMLKTIADIHKINVVEYRIKEK